MSGYSVEVDEAFLRALVTNASEGLLTIDADSRVVFANPAIESILGYRPEELIGSKKMKIVPERLRSAHESGLDQYLRSGEKHVDWTGVELPALHKEGHEVPVSVSLREHTYRGDRLFTAIVTDITERKRRERRLREQTNELEEFAGVLSHDLRNPLSVAKGYLRIAREADDGEELRRVDDALVRIEQIIDDTLAHALGEDAVEDREVVSLRELVLTAWESVLTHEAGLALPPETVRIRVHRGRVQQLIENLLRNSLEHGSTGRQRPAGDADEHGSADDRARSDDDAPDHADGDVAVRVGVLPDGDGFYVEDDGPGIPEGVLVRMERPSRPSRADGGYGLRIAETVADEHGWEMRLTDASAGGARVEFRGVTFVRP